MKFGGFLRLGVFNSRLDCMVTVGDCALISGPQLLLLFCDISIRKFERNSVLSVLWYAYMESVSSRTSLK